MPKKKVDPGLQQKLHRPFHLPVNISRKVLMEKCRIYATAYNPFIFVKDKQLKDTDPETNGSDAFPTYRQFVFGVNLTF